jgi:hypothetical protein
MRRLLVLASLLLATPAIAQQQYVPTDEMLLRQATSCETLANQQLQGQAKQIADLNTKLTAVTKERDDLKAAAKPPTKDAPAPAAEK